MISRWNWKRVDWLIAIAVFFIILFVFAGHSGLAEFVRGALNLLATALIWAGNALKVIGR